MTSNGMKLLIVTQIVDKNDDVLGAFHQWIRRFAEVFESVEVICLKLGAYDLPKNVHVHSLGKEEGGGNKARYSTRFFRYAVGLRDRYDAVFVHMNPEYVVMGGPLWRLLGKTIFFWFAHKHGGFMRKVALALTHRVVSVSKESFVESDSKKFIAVGHGIDPDVYSCQSDVRSQKSDVRKAILSVSRLSPVKEYDLLIDAVRILRDSHGRNDFLVRLIGGPANEGDRDYVARLKEKIASFGLTSAFDFVGPMPNKDLLPYLCGSTAAVSMQDGGGAGKSFLESMSCGVPTVVRTPVFNDLLGEWKSSLYYDGSPEDFAAKLNTVLSLDDAARARMAATLRNIVIEHHNLKNLVRRIKTEMEALRR
jgi:glycosyltransferase involved in cell wall biosynthesis